MPYHTTIYLWEAPSNVDSFSNWVRYAISVSSHMEIYSNEGYTPFTWPYFLHPKGHMCMLWNEKSDQVVFWAVLLVSWEVGYIKIYEGLVQHLASHTSIANQKIHSPPSSLLLLIFYSCLKFYLLNLCQQFLNLIPSLCPHLPKLSSQYYILSLFIGLIIVHTQCSTLTQPSTAATCSNDVSVFFALTSNNQSYPYFVHRGTSQKQKMDL